MIDYAVLHPDQTITVKIDGHPFGSLERAEQEARQFGNAECDECGEPANGRPHTILYREVAQWAHGD